MKCIGHIELRIPLADISPRTYEAQLEDSGRQIRKETEIVGKNRRGKGMAENRLQALLYRGPVH
jgi:hypothetical protein